MNRQGQRGGVLLLEVILGLLLILLIVLVVASLFPTSYQASLQAARASAALSLGRQVLERQKSVSPGLAIGNQTVDSEFLVQGRPVVCRFIYRLDVDSALDADPRLWKVTVQWEHSSKIKELSLVGACPHP
jgi:Tfp pilus assembly protein PilV